MFYTRACYWGLIFMLATFITLIIAVAIYGSRDITFVRCGINGKIYLEDEVHGNCRNIINCDNNPKICWEENQ